MNWKSSITVTNIFDITSELLSAAIWIGRLPLLSFTLIPLGYNSYNFNIISTDLLSLAAIWIGRLPYLSLTLTPSGYNSHNFNITTTDLLNVAAKWIGRFFDSYTLRI